MAAVYSEPSPRWGHCSAAVQGQLYVWGGRTRGGVQCIKEIERSNLHVLDPFTESWETKSTTYSEAPTAGIHLSACASEGSNLYVYGGSISPTYYINTFYRLDVTTLIWKELPSGPTKKCGCRMIHYNEQLLLYGGFGMQSESTEQEADFINPEKADISEGWTNELHSFDLKEGE